MSTNPYDNGFILGARFDLAVGNMNAEPLSAKDFLTNQVKTADGWVGGAYKLGVNDNRVSLVGDLARVSGAMAHCRAYSVDNLWHTIKTLVGVLDKKAYITHQAGYDGVDGHIQTALGTICMSLSSLYSAYGYKNSDMNFMLSTEEKWPKQQLDLLRALHICVGLLFCLLDRRTVAEQHRREYGPLTERCVERTDKVFYYHGCNNFFAFHPALTHMMFGAARMAMFIVVNDRMNDILSTKECSNNILNKIIGESDYLAVEALWDKIKSRFSKIQHPSPDNPFDERMLPFIDYMRQFGFGALGPKLYDNWWMNRKKKNYVGHFSDLESWENDARQLFEKNEKFKEFLKCQQKTVKSS